MAEFPFNAVLEMIVPLCNVMGGLLPFPCGVGLLGSSFLKVSAKSEQLLCHIFFHLAGQSGKQRYCQAALLRSTLN